MDYFQGGNLRDFLHYFPDREVTDKEENINMPSWTNHEAAELAQEILSDAKKTALRERVEGSVAELRSLLEGTSCGSTLTFMKTGDKGQHYFYAAVKNGEKWYTTAQNPRILETDNDLITWLIGLEIYEPTALGHTPPAKELQASPIETVAVES